MEGGGRTRVRDSRRGDLFFSGNVVGHLTAEEEEEEQETESVLGCALRRLGRVFGSNAPPPLSFDLKAPVAPEMVQILCSHLTFVHF